LARSEEKPKRKEEENLFRCGGKRREEKSSKLEVCSSGRKACVSRAERKGTRGKPPATAQPDRREMREGGRWQSLYALEKREAKQIVNDTAQRGKPKREQTKIFFFGWRVITTALQKACKRDNHFTYTKSQKGGKPREERT